MTTETAPSPAPASDGRGGRARGKGDRGPGPVARSGIFYKEVVAELRKVIYPSRQQLITYTTVVLFFVTFMTALVSALDFGLSKAVIALFS